MISAHEGVSVCEYLTTWHIPTPRTCDHPIVVVWAVRAVRRCTSHSTRSQPRTRANTNTNTSTRTTGSARGGIGRYKRAARGVIDGGGVGDSGKHGGDEVVVLG